MPHRTIMMAELTYFGLDKRGQSASYILQALRSSK